MAKITKRSYETLKLKAKELGEEIEQAKINLEIATQHGDLRENSDRDDAMEEIAIKSKQKYDIEKIIANSEPVDPSSKPEIDIGSYIRVTKYNLNKNTIPHTKTVISSRIFMLDSIEDYMAGIIGIKSRLGAMILNKQSGNFTLVNNVGKQINYHIEKLMDNAEELFEEDLKAYKSSLGL